MPNEQQPDEGTIDTLTVRFVRDGDLWGALVGPDLVKGSGGFGATPLEALRDLCEIIARDEGVKTDNGRLLLR
jgi:hypothetical protein